MIQSKLQVDQLDIDGLIVTSPTGTHTVDYLSKFKADGLTDSLIHESGGSILVESGIYAKQPITTTLGDGTSGLFIYDASGINGAIQQLSFGYSRGFLPTGVIANVVTSVSANTMSALVFGTRGTTANVAVTERMRIHPSGHVSIGKQTDGGYYLEVNGSFRANQRSTIYGGVNTTMGLNSSLTIGDTGASGATGNLYQIAFHYNDAAYASAVIGAVSVSGSGDTRAELFFALRNSTSNIAPVEVARVFGNGNWGFKTNTNAGYLVDVNGTLRVVSNSTFNGDGLFTAVPGGTNFSQKLVFSSVKPSSGNAVMQIYMSSDQADGTLPRAYISSDGDIELSTADNRITVPGNIITKHTNGLQLQTFSLTSGVRVYNGSSQTSGNLFSISRADAATAGSLTFMTMDYLGASHFYGDVELMLRGSGTPEYSRTFIFRARDAYGTAVNTFFQMNGGVGGGDPVLLMKNSFGGFIFEAGNNYLGVPPQVCANAPLGLMLYTNSVVNGIQIGNGYIQSTGNLLRIFNQNNTYANIEAVSGNTYWLKSGGSMGLGATFTLDPSAILHLDSTTKGFLPSRMTATQAEAIVSPAEGLLVYATNGTGTTIISKGWWGYTGSTWAKLN